MNERNPAMRELVRRLTSCQPRLYAYIMTLLLDPTRSEDVLQQTNLVIWEKADEFAECDNFEARACKVAYFQALANRRDTTRERRRLLFNPEMLENVAQRASDRLESVQGSYVAMLHDCMEKLSEWQRELLHKRYAAGATVGGLAANRGESPDATSAMLYRIRKKLLACIQRGSKQVKDV